VASVLRNGSIVVGSVYPLPYVPEFLTVKEAARLTGKSPSSIRRVMYPIIHDDKHADRKHIRPSVEDALKLRIKGQKFAWRMNEELLRREVPFESGTEKGSPSSQRESIHGDGELLAMLRRELDIKNQQITQQSELIKGQMELINGLSERLREGNVMMHSLQQRLALPDGRARATVDPAEAKHSTTTTPLEKGSKAPGKASKPKKNFLRRIFG
jgi:hypothetical protein